MFKINQTACFSGHRVIRKQDAELTETLYKILENLIRRGYLYFGAGGAKGFDALAAETVLCLKQKYPQIHLILILPFYNQYEHENNWTENEINQYQKLKRAASKIVHIQEKYSPGCYYRRNRYLVDFSSVCICYQYRDSGGTAYTTKYAQQRGLKIINCIKEI